MAYIKLGNKKEVILKLSSNIPKEWNSEATNYIQEVDSTLYVSLRDAICFRETSNVEAKIPEDYLKGSDCVFEYEILGSAQYSVHVNSLTKEEIDTSIPGQKAPCYSITADSSSRCTEARPWYQKYGKQIKVSKTVSEKIPFNLTPKRTRFFDRSVVILETPSTEIYNQDGRSCCGAPSDITYEEEALFASVDTKDGGSEFKRLATFHIKM